jgi:hypothetical protein
VTFTAPANGASGTFPGSVKTAPAATDASGIATAPAFTANGTVGSYNVTASVAGVGTPASFSLTNTTVQAGIHLVQQAAINQTSGTTAIVMLGQSPAAGGFLICASGNYPANVTIAGMSGGGVTWARVNGSNANRNAEIWAGGNSTGSGTAINLTYTGAASGSGFVVNCSEWSGIANSGYNDVSAGSSGTSANPSAGSVSSSNANDLVLGMVRGGYPAGGGVFGTPAGGFTALNSARTDWAFAAAYAIVSATGSYSTNWQTNPSTLNVFDGVIAAFKALP